MHIKWFKIAKSSLSLYMPNRIFNVNLAIQLHLVFLVEHGHVLVVGGDDWWAGNCFQCSIPGPSLNLRKISWGADVTVPATQRAFLSILRTWRMGPFILRIAWPWKLIAVKRPRKALSATKLTGTQSDESFPESSNFSLAYLCCLAFCHPVSSTNKLKKCFT